MTADELEAEFQPRAVPYSGGLLLLRPGDAVALIRRAEELRIGILGIDGIFVEPGQTVSPLEHIVDFSIAHMRGDGCWGESESFVVQRRTLGLVFEVTLGRHLAPTI